MAVARVVSRPGGAKVAPVLVSPVIWLTSYIFHPKGLPESLSPPT